MPSDFTSDIPLIGVQWLKKYELSQNEIKEHRIGWSQTGWMIRNQTVSYSPLMIFPIVISGNLVMFQARYFGSEKLPKYWTKGNKNCYYFLHPRVAATSQLNTTIVIVEDLISAIKVSHIAHSIPIWGSDISVDIAIQLHNRYKDLVIWLDKDKRKYAHARSQSLRHLFDSVRVIHSEGDPKEYSTNEIRNYLFA